MTTPISTRAQQHAVTRGVVYVHDAAKAFCKPIEWALADVLGYEAVIHWIPQPIAPARLRMELSWTGVAGTGARVVHALQQIPDLRFEVTEESTASTEGERFACTPSLGIFRAHMALNGDILVNEQRIRTVLDETDDVTVLRNSLSLLLGRAWDAELEAFRLAGEGTPVRYLHRVG